VCADDRRFAPLREQGQALLAFLTRDLLLHHQDEEEDLFPLLKTRCKPEDGIEVILAELNRDHATEGFLIRDIAVDLREIIEGKKAMSLTLLKFVGQASLVDEAMPPS
jgi:iron-sulfur cluster repair protein YtfE (RIC family)